MPGEYVSYAVTEMRISENCLGCIIEHWLVTNCIGDFLSTNIPGKNINVKPAAIVAFYLHIQCVSSLFSLVSTSNPFKPFSFANKAIYIEHTFPFIKTVATLIWSKVFFVWQHTARLLYSWRHCSPRQYCDAIAPMWCPPMSWGPPPGTWIGTDTPGDMSPKKKSFC